MANFGVRFAHAVPEQHSPAAPAATPLGRLVRAIFRMVDEAPFDMAWPPSAHGLSRHAWPAGAPAARVTGRARAGAGDARREPPRARRAMQPTPTHA